MFAFRIKHQNTYILQQFIDSNKDFSPEALYTAVFLHRDTRQAMKNIKTYLRKIYGFIAEAFDAFYNFLDLVMRIGMAACILALKLIIHLLRPVIAKLTYLPTKQ